jgi:hypothetical protein
MGEQDVWQMKNLKIDAGVDDSMLLRTGIREQFLSTKC